MTGGKLVKEIGIGSAQAKRGWSSPHGVRWMITRGGVLRRLLRSKSLSLSDSDVFRNVLAG